MHIVAQQKASSIRNYEDKHKGLNQRPTKSEFIVEFTLKFSEKKREKYVFPRFDVIMKRIHISQ